MKIGTNLNISNDYSKAKPTKKESTNTVGFVTEKENSFMSKVRNQALKHYAMAALALATTAGINTSCVETDKDMPIPEEAILSNLQDIQKLNNLSHMGLDLFYKAMLDKEKIDIPKNIVDIYKENQNILKNIADNCKDNDVNKLGNLFATQIDSNTIDEELSKTEYLNKIDNATSKQECYEDTFAKLLDIRTEFTAKLIYNALMSAIEKAPEAFEKDKLSIIERANSNMTLTNIEKLYKINKDINNLNKLKEQVYKY